MGTDDTIVGLAAAAALAAMGVAVVSWPDWFTRRARPLAVGLGVTAAVIGILTYPAYIDERYREPPYHSAAVDLDDARIALHGINLQFMYYGSDLGNHVQYVGRVRDGVISPPASCDEWRLLVNEGSYSHIVIGPLGADGAGPYQWTRDDPSVTLIEDIDGTINVFDPSSVSGNVVALFRVDGPLHPGECPA